MKRIAGMLLLIILSPLVIAGDTPPPLTLDTILFQVAAKQWVTTQTALLGVNINVTLNNADLVRARADIMTSLNKIAKGDWHLVQFDRSQDNSGLEKLYVQAQARVNQAALTDIYQSAKTVSMPGAKYEITGVEFKPSVEETQAIRAKIREQLYQKISDEIARVNKAYPGQNYSVSHVIFTEGEHVPTPPRLYKTQGDENMATTTLAAAPAPLTVSNELAITAVVEAASNRK